MSNTAAVLKGPIPWLGAMRLLEIRLVEVLQGEHRLRQHLHLSVPLKHFKTHFASLTSLTSPAYVEWQPHRIKARGARF